MASLSEQYQRSIPPVYGQSQFESILQDYLPITGGTMLGDIDMNGHKITNLGQQNLVGTDAVTQATVTNMLNAAYAVRPSFRISTSLMSSIEIPSSGSHTSLLPGIFNNNILSTNWNLVTGYDGIKGYRLGVNNVFGDPLSYKLRVRLLFNYTSNTGTDDCVASVYVRDIANASVIMTASSVIPAGSSDIYDIVGNVPFSDISQLETTMVFVMISHVGSLSVTTMAIKALYFVFTD